MWNNPNQRKAFFEKLKAGQGSTPQPQVAIQPKAPVAPIINSQPQQIHQMPNQFIKPINYENRQLQKKTKLPRLQTFFNVKKTGI